MFLRLVCVSLALVLVAEAMEEKMRSFGTVDGAAMGSQQQETPGEGEQRTPQAAGSGAWSEPLKCPSFMSPARGFQLQVLDGAVTGFRLICVSLKGEEMVLTSLGAIEDESLWRTEARCVGGPSKEVNMYSFLERADKRGRVTDMLFMCATPQNEYRIEGNGAKDGDWRRMPNSTDMAWAACPLGSGLSGFQTRAVLKEQELTDVYFIAEFRFACSG